MQSLSACETATKAQPNSAADVFRRRKPLSSEQAGWRQMLIETRRAAIPGAAFRQDTSGGIPLHPFPDAGAMRSCIRAMTMA
jgi:hypothetical protein